MVQDGLQKSSSGFLRMALKRRPSETSKFFGRNGKIQNTKRLAGAKLEPDERVVPLIPQSTLTTNFRLAWCSKTRSQNNNNNHKRQVVVQK